MKYYQDQGYLTFGSKEKSKEYKHTDTQKGSLEWIYKYTQNTLLMGKLQLQSPAHNHLHFHGILISLLPFAKEENSSKI